MSGQPRLVELADLVGVENPELRSWLKTEVDRAVRARTQDAIEEDLIALFRADPGYVGRGPQTISAQRAERFRERRAS